jgi:hypothetical protein
VPPSVAVGTVSIFGPHGPNLLTERNLAALGCAPSLEPVGAARVYAFASPRLRLRHCVSSLTSRPCVCSLTSRPCVCSLTSRPCVCSLTSRARANVCECPCARMHVRVPCFESHCQPNLLSHSMIRPYKKEICSRLQWWRSCLWKTGRWRCLECR